MSSGALPDEEGLERDIARYRTLSRLGCLGVLASLVVLLVGAALVFFGYDAADEPLTVSGFVVLAVGLALGLAASAFNMGTFGLYLAKQAQRRRR